jgi:hypothetical protein
MDRLESCIKWLHRLARRSCTMHNACMARNSAPNFQTFAPPAKMALVLLALALAAKPTLYDMKAFTTDGHLMDLAEVSVIHHT